MILAADYCESKKEYALQTTQRSIHLTACLLLERLCLDLAQLWHTDIARNRESRFETSYIDMSRQRVHNNLL